MSKQLPSTVALPKPRDANETIAYRSLIAFAADVAYILNEETAKFGDENIFTEAQVVRLDDATNNAVTTGLTISHETTGAPSAGIGVGLNFEVETAADHLEVGASIQAVTTDLTNNSEDFDLVFQTMVAGAIATIAKFSRTATATHTGFMIYDVDNNTVERVTVGAADSGGAGFKVLRIPN